MGKQNDGKTLLNSKRIIITLVRHVFQSTDKLKALQGSVLGVRRGAWVQK